MFLRFLKAICSANEVKQALENSSVLITVLVVSTPQTACPPCGQDVGPLFCHTASEK